MRRLAPLGALALLLGCGIVLGLERHRVVGVVAGVEEDDPHIGVPDTVDAGRSFRVTIRTYVGGCTRAGDTDVEVDGSEVVVTPYDLVRYTGGDRGCGVGGPEPAEHSAEVRIDRPGAAELTFRGRRLGERMPIGYRRAVFVR